LISRASSSPAVDAAPPFGEIARRATHQLFDRIQGNADHEVIKERIVPELIVRASTTR
jgi:DNA-binding LacI/PurR family transcriptional regulator